jgi:uncharacterized protein (DUF1330 family)
MTVYVVAQLDVTDRAAYDRYRARLRGVLDKFDGRVLASDEHPRIVEGHWKRDKIVLLSFADDMAF